jgi:hypothetical protein
MKLAQIADPFYVLRVNLPGRARWALVVALIAAVTLAAASGASAATPPRATQAQQYQVPLPLTPAYLTPIPVVRLVGRLTRTGAQITLLRIRAPRSTTVSVRCGGGRRRGCRHRSRTKRAGRSGLVRFREYQRRFKAGAVLAVFVRRGNTVGKYTRFTIRKRKLPRRVDRCLFPGDPFEPAACP